MAISSPRESNRVPSLIVTSNADGLTPMLVYAISNALKIEDGTSGTSIASTNAQRDANRVPVMWATSSADGRTPVPIYGNPITNAVLVKST